MPRERKILLIGGTILLVLGALYRFSGEIGDFFSTEDTLLAQKKRLTAYRSAVQEKDRLQAELAELNQALARTEGRLLSGTTPALAGVDLQNLLTEVAARNRVQIDSMRVLNAVEAANGYLAIPVQVDFKSDIRQMLGVFYRLETASKMVRIANVRLRVGSAGRWQELNVSFTVEGFMAGEVG